MGRSPGGPGDSPPAIHIRLENLNLHRGDRAVLRHVTWHLRPGERWLVVGASGAGKTQLLKILAGDVWPDDANPPPRHFEIEGERHDEPADVRDEIAWLGPERQDRYERYGWNFTALQVVGTGLQRSDIPLEALTAEQTTRCLRLLRRAGIARLAARKFLTLSYGERRLVLLARVLAWRASWLLLDEVATGLDMQNRARLLTLLGGRHQDVSSWVCTAHRADDVPPAANRLLWLVAGRIRHAGAMQKDLLRKALGKAQTRTALPHAPKMRRRATPVVIEMRHASVWAEARRVLLDIDLEICRGQCWVLHGANGSGKSTLLRTLYGDLSVASDGVLRRAGVVPGVPLDSFRARTGLIAPHLQTDYPRYHTVLETVVSGVHSSIGLNEKISTAERRRAISALKQFDMQGFADRPLSEMSYGQVRRVLFARAAVLRPSLLLMDEPFTGLNAPLRAELQKWLAQQIACGVTVVIATHYRSEWPRNASHEMMLSGGRARYAGRIRK